MQGHCAASADSSVCDREIDSLESMFKRSKNVGNKIKTK